MDSSYRTGSATVPGPVPYDQLDSLLPSGLTLPSSAPRLAGYDIDYTRLVLNRMLGLNTTYITQGTYGELYLALREGFCDVAVSAVEFDPGRAQCTAACPAIAPNTNVPLLGDYVADGSWSDATLAKICCLDYGAPYLSQGFALASRTLVAPPGVLEALLSPEVCNIATVAATITIIIGWVICFCEWRVNPELATVDRGTLWSISMLTTMGFADTAPRTRIGRTLAVLWTVASVVTISTFTSIVGSKLTVSSIAVGVVNALGDVRGTLCVEQAYPTAMSFVTRSPQRPASVVEKTVPECFELLQSGAVGAVLTDRPVLSWYRSTYGLERTYVSPVLAPNPFSFVYASGSPLRQYINPAVIAAQTDPDWIALSDQLTQRYFGGDDGSGGGGTVSTPFDYNSIISAAVLGFATILMSILNGNAFPRMPERVQRAFCAPPRPGPAGDAMVELNDSLDNAMEKLQVLRDAVYHAGAHTAGNGESPWAALDAWKGSGRFESQRFGSTVTSPRTARVSTEAVHSGHAIPPMKLSGEPDSPESPPIMEPPQQLPPLPPPPSLAPLRLTPNRAPRPPSELFGRALNPQPPAVAAPSAAETAAESDTFAEMSAALVGPIPIGANGHRHRHRNHAAPPAGAAEEP